MHRLHLHEPKDPQKEHGISSMAICFDNMNFSIMESAMSCTCVLSQLFDGLG